MFINDITNFAAYYHKVWFNITGIFFYMNSNLSRKSKLGIALAIFSLLAGIALLSMLQLSSAAPNNEVLEVAAAAGSENNETEDDVEVDNTFYSLSVDNTLTSFQDNGDGTFTLNYRFQICNTYSFPLRLDTVTHRLSQNGSLVNPTVLSFTSPTLPLRGGYNGNGEMLAASTTLPAGTCAVINLSVRVDYSPTEPTINSFVSAQGRRESASSTRSATSSRTSSRTSTSRTSGSRTSSAFSSIVRNPSATSTSEEAGGGDDSDFYIDEAPPTPPPPPPAYCGKTC